MPVLLVIGSVSPGQLPSFRLWLDGHVLGLTFLVLGRFWSCQVIFMPYLARQMSFSILFLMGAVSPPVNQLKGSRLPRPVLGPSGCLLDTCLRLVWLSLFNFVSKDFDSVVFISLLG